MSELIRPARKGSRWDVPRDRPYLVARIKSGHDWWDLDDALAAIPGRVVALSRSQFIWHAIPEDRLSDLESLDTRRPGAVIVHRA